MIRKTVLLVCILILSLSLASCATVSVAPTATASETTTTVAPPTEVPSGTPEAPVSLESDEIEIELPNILGSGDVLFDIYSREATTDINSDGAPEKIKFTAGEEESLLTVNGTDFTVPQKGLAQLFAITDVNKDDGILELLFTEQYDPALPEGTYAFSWLYWWNGTEVINMGGLMDVKFAGAWLSSFSPADYFDAKGTVKCLTATDEFTYIEYIGQYEPSGDDRKLKEKLYSADPIKTKKVKCKQPCVLLKEITKKYYSSAFDYYWITNLWPYTAGRVPDVEEGISIIAQPDEQLTIVKVYGKYWFKMKTSDGYYGWIRCEDNEVHCYKFTMGWNADDMFSGL